MGQVLTTCCSAHILTVFPGSYFKLDWENYGYNTFYHTKKYFHAKTNINSSNYIIVFLGVIEFLEHESEE